MAIITLFGKEYQTRLEYKEIKAIEKQQGIGFIKILSNFNNHDISFSVIEDLIFAAIQNKDFNRAEFAEYLEQEYGKEDGEISIDMIFDIFTETFEESVFIKKLQAQEMKNKQRAAMRRANIGQ